MLRRYDDIARGHEAVGKYCADQMLALAK